MDNIKHFGDFSVFSHVNYWITNNYNRKNHLSIFRYH